jgi:type I restriction enzyme S subunit
MAVNRAVLYAPYLNYFLNTCQGQLSLKAVASRAVSQSNISASKLRSLRIPVPTLNEQRSISDVLVAVDTKLVFEENRKSALQSLFKTMLHLLMTGQLRVKDLKIEN